MTKISVVMPSYLGEYDGCASNREDKFIRAVESFDKQNYDNKELVIVSDGCEKTVALASAYISHRDDNKIKLLTLPKQPLFSGNVRQQGILKATGDLICYLDSDDIFGDGHLLNIVNNYNKDKFDWCYYNDVMRIKKTFLSTRNAELKHSFIGTSNIAHRKLSKALWKNCDGYGHDWTFIQSLIKNYPNNKKIYGCNYQVCHVPKQFES